MTAKDKNGSYTNEFYEQYTKNVLEFYFKNKFIGLNKSESPDFKNNQIGVEVTRAMLENNGALSAFYKQYEGKTYLNIPNDKLNKFGFINAPVSFCKNILFEQKSKDNGTLIYIKTKNGKDLVLSAIFGTFKSITNCSEVISKRIKNKLEKMNDHYVLQKENDLAIMVHEQLNYLYGQDEIIISEVMQKVILEIKNIYTDLKYKNKFDYIYLLFIDNIFCINAKTFDYERTMIPTTELGAIMSKTINEL